MQLKGYGKQETKLTITRYFRDLKQHVVKNKQERVRYTDRHNIL